MKPKYTSQPDSFVIDNYNSALPFADFFPALAGVTGKPLWLFYTNRGQCVSSFGVNNKDGSMVEFLPANKAYQATPLMGFRTFIKIGSKKGYVEPFTISGEKSHQSMTIRPYELEIVDRNPETNLETRVVYFGVPGESCPVLARAVTIKNLGSSSLDLRVADGLPRVVPFGMNDYLVKNMSRTIEAFAEVLNLEGDVPFYKLKIEPHDRPDIRWLSSGFFSFTLGDSGFIPYIVDPGVLFGQDTSFVSPMEFAEKAVLSTGKQMTANIMPCAFVNVGLRLKGKESKSWTSYFGYATSVTRANDFALSVRSRKDFEPQKRAEMKQIYDDLIGHFGLKTELDPLNQYAAATFMDNVLRGGFPLAFGSDGLIMHVFSRKHGDMERDYNAFHISASYYSQGNGNYRDVNQNRRNDLLLNSKVDTTNLETFLNLLQLDGYNPLVINPEKYVLPRDFISRLELKMSDQCRMDYQQLLREPALAGRLYEFLKEYAADELSVPNYFRDVISVSTPVFDVSHGEGFWIDHWVYNLDHLDQYMSVFPDKKHWVLFEKNDFTFYDSDHFVRPRREKYVLTKEGKLRQYGAVVVHPAKKELLANRTRDVNKVRTDGGKGEVFKTSLFIKLLALASVKAATLDPNGTGIEMEADKPGWCDALNGAPGLLGSSTHELFELRRLFGFLLKAIEGAQAKTLDIPYEIYALIHDTEKALEKYSFTDFRPTWDLLATARESYREKTLLGLSGKIKNLRFQDLKNYFLMISAVLDKGSQRAVDPKTKLPVSYFTYEADTHKLGDGWRQFLFKLPLKVHAVAPFLEGAVHAMKLSNPVKAKVLYQAVRRSDLYDKKLGMYRLNAPLGDETDELGRVRIFTPGWLENESIFLHMHYKFLLEILRSGMTEAFLKEAPTGLIPFRDSETYGRPTFENSSFVASSAFPNPIYHGRGYVARLSGATSEFLSMIYFMAFGPHFFKLEQGQLIFSPQPHLPKEWFTKTDKEGSVRNSLSIRLFDVPITYVNPSRKNTFGPGAAKPVSYEWILDGRFYEHKGRTLANDVSLALREGRLESLTITLG